MNRTESLVFDRAVDYYDRTRALSSTSMAKILPFLQDRFGDGPCLEIGVGTGRIALPLSDEGTTMIGLDLSEPMMRRLIANAGGRMPFPLLSGDAGALPFADNSFTGGLAVHVLHLIPQWRAAARELTRVVRPGGALVIDIGRQTKGPFRELLAQFARAAGIEEDHRGVNEPEELDEVLSELGIQPEGLEVVTEIRSATYNKTIGALEAGTYSITWSADESTRKAAAEQTRRWAEDRYGDLAHSYDYHLAIELRSYRLSPGDRR